MSTVLSVPAPTELKVLSGRQVVNQWCYNQDKITAEMSAFNGEGCAGRAPGWEGGVPQGVT